MKVEHGVTTMASSAVFGTVYAYNGGGDNDGSVPLNATETSYINGE